MAKRMGSPDAVARGLGWFSIGLGIVELLAPHALARGTGMRGNERLIAGYGAREIATGIGLLTAKDPEPWLWGRVAGDALDVGTLATALEGHNARREGASVALAAVLGVAAIDIWAAAAFRARKRRAARRAMAPDYSTRRGLPRPPEAMRGAARDFEVPRDFRTPEALRPWTTAAA